MINPWVRVPEPELSDHAVIGTISTVAGSSCVRIITIKSGFRPRNRRREKL